MRIGLTYDLRDDYLRAGFAEEDTAEFDQVGTIDVIDSCLSELGYQTDRIGRLSSLVERLARGDQWDLVFNIAEGMYGMAREAQVPALLDAYQIPYTFSDPVVLGLTLHKGLTKHVLRDLGLRSAPFAVIESLADLPRVDLRLPLFVKPIGEGTGKGIDATSKVISSNHFERKVKELLARFCQPVLVEEYLPGREFTVGLLGTGPCARAIGALEIVLNDAAESEVYSYKNKEYCEELVTYRLVDDSLAREACALALDCWRALGCRDAGRIDLRTGADGRVYLLEVNPLAGMHPQHSDLPILWAMTGGRYVDLIRNILESAFQRSGTRKTATKAIPSR